MDNRARQLDRQVPAFTLTGLAQAPAQRQDEVRAIVSREVVLKNPITGCCARVRFSWPRATDRPHYRPVQ